MGGEQHQLAELVYAAKDDVNAADNLIRQYMGFIKSETFKFTNKAPVEGWDDELSIAMLAFHEAIMGYSRFKGPFIKYAARTIRSRLIDYYRKEKRHMNVISYDAPGEENTSLTERLDSGRDEAAEITIRQAAKMEILEFDVELNKFGIELTEIAENCPKQKRTLQACQRALEYAKLNPYLLDELVKKGRLPIAELSAGAGVDRKTLERHRKYMVALLLAFTNGFEIIRGHIKSSSSLKGGGAI